MLEERGISPSRIGVLEVYAGSGNFIAACRAAGLWVGPPIDINAMHTHGGRHRWNLLLPEWRRMLWAILVVRKPRWIHSGFPPAFWLTLKKSWADRMAIRLRELTHVILTIQLAMWQHRHNLVMSLENPAGAQSWELDIMLDMIAATGMKQARLDSCAWGSHDPATMKPFLKRLRIAASASVDLSSLERRCSCPGGQQRGTHAQIEGSTRMQGAAVRRASLAAQYPAALCNYWARIVKEHLRDGCCG